MTNHPLTPRRHRAARAEARAEVKDAPIVPTWAILALAIGAGLLALI